MRPGQKRNKPTWPDTIRHPSTSAYSATSLPANRVALYLVIRRIPVQRLGAPTRFGSADRPILPRPPERTSRLPRARRLRRFAARCPPRSTEPAGCLRNGRAATKSLSLWTRRSAPPEWFRDLGRSNRRAQCCRPRSPRRIPFTARAAGRSGVCEPSLPGGRRPQHSCHQNG